MSNNSSCTLLRLSLCLSRSFFLCTCLCLSIIFILVCRRTWPGTCHPSCPASASAAELPARRASPAVPRRRCLRTFHRGSSSHGHVQNATSCQPSRGYQRHAERMEGDLEGWCDSVLRVMVCSAGLVRRHGVATRDTVRGLLCTSSTPSESTNHTTTNTHTTRAYRNGVSESKNQISCVLGCPDSC